MKIDTFGIATDIVGTRKLELTVDEECTVKDLKKILFEQYTEFNQLKQLAIAVNCEYVLDESQRLHIMDDIVLIPPVSGG